VRRRLITIVIFLLAGAVVNVGVAWGCALWSDLPLGRQYAAPSPSEAAWWKAHAPAVIGSDPIVVGLKAARGLTVKQLSGLRHNPGAEIEAEITKSGEWFKVTIIATDPRVPTMLRWDHVVRAFAGWPFRSLGGDRWQGGPSASPDFRDPDKRRYLLLDDSLPRPGDVYRSAVPISRGRPPGGRAGLLPLRPVWPGFAVNAAVYGAALWVLAVAVVGLRRFGRVRRRRCPACGYPIGEAAVCTECGKPLPKRAVA
jgi:hypothetical protein